MCLEDHKSFLEDKGKLDERLIHTDWSSGEMHDIKHGKEQLVTSTHCEQNRLEKI